MKKKLLFGLKEILNSQAHKNKLIKKMLIFYQIHKKMSQNNIKRFYNKKFIPTCKFKKKIFAQKKFFALLILRKGSQEKVS